MSRNQGIAPCSQCRPESPIRVVDRRNLAQIAMPDRAPAGRPVTGPSAVATPDEVGVQVRAYPGQLGRAAPKTFEHLYGIGPAGQAETITMLDTPYLVQEWELPSPVVLLSGQGHYWLALDYRHCGPAGHPPVVWIDNEMDHELTLAPSFRAFVERLTASASSDE